MLVHRAASHLWGCIPTKRIRIWIAESAYDQNRCQMKLMLIDGTVRRRICTMPFKNNRQPAPRKAGCAVNSLFKAITYECVCQFVCMHWQVCRVHYQEGPVLCPQGHRWCPETFSLVYSRGGSLSILCFLFLKTHISLKNTITEGGQGAVGWEKEAEGRTRKRNRGFKEGKWEEKDERNRLSTPTIV